VAKKLLSLTAVRLILLGMGALLVGKIVGLGASAMGSNSGLLANGATQLVIIAAFFFGQNWHLPKLVWCKGCLLGGICLGVLSSLIVFGFYWILSLLGFAFEPQASVEALRLASGLSLVLMVMQAVFGAALAEELYFRGWWLNYLRERISGWVAVLLLAAVFALIHFTPDAFPGLLLLGLILGFAALRWGVSAAVIAHMVFNLISIVAVRGGWM